MPLLLPPNVSLASTTTPQKIALAYDTIQQQFAKTTLAIRFGLRKCLQYMGDESYGVNPLGLSRADFEAGISGPQLADVNQKKALAKVALLLAGALETTDALTPEELPVMKACALGILNTMNAVTPGTVSGATIAAVESI